MSVALANSLFTVKAKDRLQVTITAAWWASDYVLVAWWNAVPRYMQYVRTVSQVPIGARKVAVVDVAVTELGNGKSYGQLAADMDRVLGVEISEIKPLTASDLRTAVAPGRVQSAEKVATDRLAAANPLNKIFNLGSGLTKVLGLVAIALILFYVVPLLRKK